MRIDKIERDLEHLETSDLETLRTFWKTRFGTPPPRLRSVRLLQHLMAWRIQVIAYGGVDSITRRVLKRRGPVEPEGRDLGIGAVLRRVWNGQTVEVVVEQDGFRSNGELYPSLSAIARAVTGTRWNGPRFFGLRDERS